MIASGAIALLCAGTASANCLDGVYNETLPITALSPADGASMAPAGSLPVSFALASPVQASGLSVRVTSQSTLGQNGTLSDLNTLDEFALADSITDPGNYRGVSNKGSILWNNHPGTYYWQIFGTAGNYGTPTPSDVCHAYASPVFTITVTAPPPPPVTTPSPRSVPTPSRLTFNDARSYAVTMIRQRTRHNISRGTITCTGVNDWTRHCNLAWASGGYSYHASGRFWNYVGSDGKAYWWYDFRGTRTSLTCAERHPRSYGCTQRFHWH
jgi:hypothetical protein